jgi:hypothetical protein
MRNNVIQPSMFLTLLLVGHVVLPEGCTRRETSFA